MIRLRAGIVAVVVACSGAQTPPPPPTNGSAATGMFSKADSYEHYMGRWSRQLVPQLVAFAGVHDGDVVLDVGSGTGALSFAVRDAMKSSHVTGIDPSPEFVRFASAHNTDPRVQFAVGDAQQLKLANATFDKTLAMLVMNFIPDRGLALHEMIRVTKPGGTIAAAVWDYGEGMTMLRVFFDEIVAVDPSAKGEDESHMPLSRRGELAALWQQSGLVDVEETALTTELHFASFDDYWSPFLLGVGPGGALFAKLTGEQRVALHERLRKRLLGDGPDRPFVVPVRAWAVKGTVARSQ